MKMMHCALLLALATAPAAAVTCQNNLPASNPDSSYRISGDGVLTHVPTGLIWKRCAEGQTWTGTTCTGSVDGYDWATALAVAEASTFAGRTDWRLPNIKELRSLVEECRSAPPINDTLFPNTPVFSFWSSTPRMHQPGTGWLVFFNNSGGLGGTSFIGMLQVRLVRGGQ